MSTFSQTFGKCLVQQGTLLNYEPETKAYISGLTTPLSLAQKSRIDTFVKVLKSGLNITNLSDKFDVLYILAGETSESSLRNIVKNLHNASAIANPVFTPFKGFKGNGVDAYIDTNYKSAQFVRFGISDASMGVYSFTDNTSLGADIGIIVDGSDLGQIVMYGRQTSVNKLSSRLNENTLDGFVVPDSLGMSIISRTGTTKSFYRNNTLLGSLTVAATGLPKNNLFLLRGNSANNFSSRELGFAFFGKGLNADDIGVINSAFAQYLTGGIFFLNDVSALNENTNLV